MAPKNPESGPLNRFGDLARRAGIDQPEVVIEKAPPTDLERAQEALRNAAVSNHGPSIQEEEAKVRASLGGKPKNSRDASRKKRGTTKKESDSKDEPKANFLGIKPKKLKERQQEVETLLDDSQSVPEEPVVLKPTDQDRISEILREFDSETALPTDPTLRETKEALGEAIAGERTRLSENSNLSGAFTSELMNELKEQQELSKIAESSYFEELKKYHKGRGAMGIAAENVVGELGTPSHIKSLRRVWVLTRAQHYNAQQAALNARLSTRPRSKEAVLESLEKYKGKGSIDESKLRERYERVVTMRTFVDGLEERELEKRREGLGERDKKALDKLYDRYKELPPAVRIFGTSAALLGVGATAGVLLGGSVIGLVPLGLAGTSAALRFWAEKNKNPAAKKWIGEMSRYTSVGGAFGALVKMGIEKGHDLRGTETKASELLSNRKGLGDLGDVKNLGRLSQKRKEALVVKESIARQSRIASALTSLGLGFLLGHHASGGHAHGTDAGVPATTPEQMNILAEGKADLAYHGPEMTAADLKTYLNHSHTPFPHASVPPETGVDAAVVPVHPTAPSTSVLEVSTKPGEGFGQLLVDLRHQVGTLEHASPELKHFLEQNPNALTHALGVAHDGQSLTLQPGDTLFVDSDQHVWYHAVGKDPQLVFEHTAPTAEAPDGYVTQHIDGHMQLDVHHHAPVHEAPSHTPEVSAAPVEDPSAALNRGQVHGTPILSLETFPDGSDLNTLTQPSDLDSTLPSEPAAQVPEQATVTPPAPEHIYPATPEAPVHSALEPFVNTHQVPVEPATTHLYGVPDESAPGGQQLLVYGGGDATNNEFLRRVQELAREHPGEKIYFEAGKLTMYNGIPQKWITSAVFDPTSGFSIGVTPEGPEMIGVLDPQSFTSRIK